MQLAFGAVGSPQESDGWDRLHSVLVAAINAITPKEFCFRTGITSGYLSDAIKGRDRKGLKAEWIPVIIAMAPDEHREAILRELATGTPFDIVRRKQLTPEERLARMEERVAREFGTAGSRLVQEERNR